MRKAPAEPQDGRAGGDLSGLLATVPGHEELSGRLAAIDLRDASDVPLGEEGRR
jgi:hypothetical protein